MSDMAASPNCTPGKVTRGCECVACDTLRDARMTYKQRLRHSRRQVAKRATEALTRPMNWNDPEARANLIERVGPAEYNRLHAEHRTRSTVSTINGRGIVPVETRFGRLFAVEGTRQAFPTRDQAETYAKTLPKSSQ